MKYRIDGENQVFDTLKDAKHHVFVAYTQQERIKYLMGGCIYGIRNDEYVTATAIIVGRDGCRFGKTEKI